MFQTAIDLKYIFLNKQYHFNFSVTGRINKNVYFVKNVADRVEQKDVLHWRKSCDLPQASLVSCRKQAGEVIDKFLKINSNHFSLEAIVIQDLK